MFSLFILLNLTQVLCFQSYFVIFLSSYHNCLFSFFLSLVFVLGESDAIPRLYVLIEGTQIFKIRGLIRNFATLYRVSDDLFVVPHNSHICFHCLFSFSSKFKECFLLHFLLPPPAPQLTEMLHCLPTKQIPIKWRFLLFLPWPEISLGGHKVVANVWGWLLILA